MSKCQNSFFNSLQECFLQHLSGHENKVYVGNEGHRDTKEAAQASLSLGYVMLCSQP